MRTIKADTVRLLRTLDTGNRGAGVFAAEDIEVGQVLCRCVPTDPARLGVRNEVSFEVARGKHFMLSWPGEYFNHSCHPNVAVRDNDRGGFDFFAIEPVLAGEELVTHYAMHEWKSVAVTACKCGAAECEGRARGFGELNSEGAEKISRMGCASHLLDPRPRGQRTLFRVKGHPFTIHSKRVVEDWVKDFVDGPLEMQRHAELMLSYYPYGTPLRGWTVMQMLTTSSLSAHFWEETQEGWIDVTSCKPFSESVAAEWLRGNLEVDSVTWETGELV